MQVFVLDWANFNLYFYPSEVTIFTLLADAPSLQTRASEGKLEAISLKLFVFSFLIVLFLFSYFDWLARVLHSHHATFRLMPVMIGWLIRYILLNR